MANRELAELTWEEVRDLERARTVAILPVGALEAHGPHLPLATDVIIARAMARAGAERLAARGIGAVLLPPLPYTAAPFGDLCAPNRCDRQVPQFVHSPDLPNDSQSPPNAPFRYPR